MYEKKTKLRTILVYEKMTCAIKLFFVDNTFNFNFIYKNLQEIKIIKQESILKQIQENVLQTYIYYI